jgi:1-acyl-sn-glycerol-3-phosphate acyltransferase
VISSAGLASLFVFNLMQTASLVLVPFSRRTFRRFNRWCASVWWGWCVLLAERFYRTRIVVTGEEVPPEENAIVIANHQQMTDITTIMAFARRERRLGDLKFFVKRQLKWFPGIGWGMQFLNCPFVDRNWTSDRERIRRTFDTLVRERIPCWMVSFVEGTRATPDKIAASRDWARERGLDLYEHVLVPRSKGFTASVAGLGDHIHAVYDLTIGYVEGVPSLWQYIGGAVRRVHLHVRRFPVSEIPAAESELRQWLLDRFAEKDRLLDAFYTTGAFPCEAEAASAATA